MSILLRYFPYRWEFTNLYDRPGWEQIADAASGCCYVMGKAYGFPEGTGESKNLMVGERTVDTG